MNYHLISTVATDEKGMPKEVGAINGGMYKREIKNDFPVIVINVSSLDESLKKVESAGGKIIMPKQQVGDMGLYARVTDTEGNVIGIWQDLK
jgi:predicted enzyme related to lactoylglutathione lyase